MSHQPPVPEGSQSPYPLQPAPIPEEAKQRAAERAADAQIPEAAGKPSSATLLGIAGAVALGAAAAVGGYLYSRGKSAPVGKASKVKRQSGKSKLGRKTAAGETRH